MSAYCDFNARLFRPFTSMKAKIVPALADDWEIIPYSYNTNDGFSLYSKKTNQQVADIDLRRFLRFCKDQDLATQGLKLHGTFIIGNDRSVYTTEMYNEWLGKFQTRTATIIDKKDAKVGHEYKTPCGMHLIYLGWRYVSNIKTTKNRDYKNYTVVKKIHYAMGVDSYKNYFEPLKNKFTEDLGQKKTEEEVDKILARHQTGHMEIVCWEKTNPGKDVKFGLIEIPLQEHKQNALLVIDSEGQMFGCENGRSVEVLYHDKQWTKRSPYGGYGGGTTMYAGRHFETQFVYDQDTLVVDLEKTRKIRDDYHYRDMGKAEKLFRIGIVS